MDEPVVAGVKAAYEKAPESWGSGPARLYRALADALLAASPVDLDGRLVLDLGTGTGVGSHALAAIGARAVGVDLARAMVRHDRARRPPGLVGDARNLPFASSAFDAVMAGFSVNHVPGPHLALAESARVTRTGGVVLASSFPSGRQHPARAAVERVLVEAGFVRPGWFSSFKERLEPAVGDATAFAATARQGGLTDVEVRELDVDTGLDTAQEIVDWRLGMAQYVEFLAGLDPKARSAVRGAAIEAVTGVMTPYVSALFLIARVP